MATCSVPPLLDAIWRHWSITNTASLVGKAAANLDTKLILPQLLYRGVESIKIVKRHIPTIADKLGSSAPTSYLWLSKSVWIHAPPENFRCSEVCSKTF